MRVGDPITGAVYSVACQFVRVTQQPFFTHLRSGKTVNTPMYKYR